MARKSRKARLNYAKWTPHQVSITPFGWGEIETALGDHLSSEQRSEISEIVAIYLEFEGMERAASFAPDEQAWLEQLRKAANGLYHLVIGAPMNNRAARSGLVKVQTALDHIITSFGGKSSSLEQVATYLPSAIDAAIRQERPPGLQEGGQWRILVATLDKKFEAWGLPHGLRKDTDKNIRKPAPFAAFFQSLQSCFPPEARRHTQSLSALAAAMNEARRDSISTEPEN
jgi:hypothetical protein